MTDTLFCSMSGQYRLSLFLHDKNLKKKLLLHKDNCFLDQKASEKKSFKFS